MTVAVVIVNYNSSVLLERCLGCLSDQTLKPDQLIIVDNASTEHESHALLKQVANAQVIYNDQNIGFGAAVNRGVQSLSDVDYICCLNPDAFPDSRWLEALVNAAEANPDYASFTSLMLLEEESGLIDGAGDQLHLSGLPRRRFHKKRRSTLEPVSVFSACAGAALYRLSDFNAAGGFDEQYFMYLEDIDLGFRLNSKNKHCMFVPESIVYHIGSATSDNDLPLYYGHRNVIRCFIKNMPTPLLILALPLHIIMNLVVVLRYATTPYAGRVVAAKLDGIKAIPAAWRDRNAGSTASIWPLLNKLWLY